jgi:hypothetical protein
MLKLPWVIYRSLQTTFASLHSVYLDQIILHAYAGYAVVRLRNEWSLGEAAMHCHGCDNGDQALPLEATFTSLLQGPLFPLKMASLPT